MNKHRPVSVTLLTGFLGSGKTTLIKHFLQTNPGYPLAIVENEFGPVNIDGLLLETGDKINIVELTAGCVCCTFRGEFTAALHELLENRNCGTIAFEHILIELTGLADPSPVAQAFFVDENLRENTVLDGCVTVVDCYHIEQQLSEHSVTVAQIGFADRIILTKTDMVDVNHRERIIQRLRNINGRAEIVVVQQGQCPNHVWLGLSAFSLTDDLTYKLPNAADDHTLSSGKAKKLQPCAEKSFKFLGSSQAASFGEDNIKSLLFTAKFVDLDKLDIWMEDLIERYGNDMLRYKGVFAIKNEMRRFIVQGVHKVVGFDYGSPWRVNEQPLSKFVVIARQLPEEELRRSFVANEID